MIQRWCNEHDATRWCSAWAITDISQKMQSSGAAERWSGLGLCNNLVLEPSTERGNGNCRTIALSSPSAQQIHRQIGTNFKRCVKGKEKEKTFIRPQHATQAEEEKQWKSFPPNFSLRLPLRELFFPESDAEETLIRKILFQFLFLVLLAVFFFFLRAATIRKALPPPSLLSADENAARFHKSFPSPSSSFLITAPPRWKAHETERKDEKKNFFFRAPRRGEIQLI
jgi:hypothetical protein